MRKRKLKSKKDEKVLNELFDTGAGDKDSKKRNREQFGDNLGQLFDSEDDLDVENIVEEVSDE